MIVKCILCDKMETIDDESPLAKKIEKPSDSYVYVPRMPRQNQQKNEGKIGHGKISHLSDEEKG